MAHRFADRLEAGRTLGASLVRTYGQRSDTLVLALPRGGVPVAYAVALALDAPLDVFIVRKLGMPGHEEFAIGAIASGGIEVLDEDVIHAYGVNDADVQRVAAAEREELARRERLYRDDRPPLVVAGHTVILVDDGLATGWSMRAAVLAVRQERPRAIVVAVPVAARETAESFRDIVDDIVVLETPDPFYAVGLWYRDFSQTDDEEVHDLLERAASRYARR